MAALSRRLCPLRCAGFYGCPFAGFYGCPFALSATSARSQSSRKVIACSARGVYGVRWRLSRFFRLLLECLCGASLQFLRSS